MSTINGWRGFEHTCIVTKSSLQHLEQPWIALFFGNFAIYGGTKIHISVAYRGCRVRRKSVRNHLHTSGSTKPLDRPRKDGLLHSLFQLTSTDSSIQANLVALTQKCRTPSGSIGIQRAWPKSFVLSHSMAVGFCNGPAREVPDAAESVDLDVF